MTSMKIVSRAVSALALGAALTIGSATIAGAQGWGNWGGNGPSRGLAPFSVSTHGDAALCGKVTAVSGDDITITDQQGFTRMIVVGSTTTFNGGSTGVVPTSLVAGTKIFAQGAVDSNGTTLDALSITFASTSTGQMGFTWGVITAVTTSSITVQSESGTLTTFTFATTTPVDAIGHNSVALTSLDLRVNEHAGVEFNTTADTTAVGIWVELAHISGVVTAVSGDTITISDHQGFTRLILVGTTTTYDGANPGVIPATLLVGAHIRAEGLVDANGTTLDALNVDIYVNTNSPQQGNQQSGFDGSGQSHRGHHHGETGRFGGGFGGGSQGNFR
ncbi:MAG: hypothetical protein ACRDVC_08815 [Acidimicrobiales bacterium]